MNFNNIVLIVDILIGLFLMIGFVWGLARGAFKSFLRLSFLIFNCIFWLLVTPSISASILNGNLTSLFTITIGGQTFTSLSSLIDYFLNTTPMVLEFISNSTILAAFIDKIPMILMNFIVFISGYFILKSITFPIYAYLANKAIALINKKNKQKWFATNKNTKNRFVGAFFGLIQGALTGMILFLPFSTVSLAFNASYQNSTSLNYSTLSISQPLLQNDSSSTNINVNSSNSNELNEFLNIYYNTFLGNTLKIMNLSSLNEFIFNQLSSIEVDGVTISLAEEIKNTTSIISRAENLLSEHNITNLNDVTTSEWIKLVGTVNYDEVEKIVDDLFSIKLLDVMSEDIMPLIYEMFNDNIANLEEIALNQPKDVNKILTYFLNSVKSGDTKTLKQDCLNILDILKTMQKNNVFGFVKDANLLAQIEDAISTNNKDSIKAVVKNVLVYSIENLKPYNEEAIKKEIVGTIFKSQTIRTLMPNIMNLIINSLNEGLNINLSDFNARISWSNETHKLANIVYCLKESAYELLPIIKNTSTMEFSTDIVKNLPLESLGTLLNTLRESQIFKDVYYNLVPQILQKYVLPEDATGIDSMNFKFINLSTINWKEELTTLKQVSTSLISEVEKVDFVNLNTSQVNFNLLQENIIKIFDSNLIKEIISLSSNILPNKTLEYLYSKTLGESVLNLVNSFAITLQEMSTDELKNDINLFLSALEQLSCIEGTTIIERSLNASESQINIVLEKLISSKLCSTLLPQVFNLAIATINAQLDINLSFNETFTLNSAQIKLLASAIYNLKTVYAEYDLIKNDLDFNNLSTLSYLSQVELEKIGTSIDTLKCIPALNEVINALLQETIFNYEKVSQVVPEEFLTCFNVTATDINNISWFNEVSMVKDFLPIMLAFVESPFHTYPDIKIDSFLTQYGNSTFLKLIKNNGLLYLFPNADVELVKQLDLVKSAKNINGIMELVLLFLDFKYNGVVEIPAMQEYRIRDAIKTVDKNESLEALVENLSQAKGLNYTELCYVIDIICDLLRGQEFSINSIAPYIDVVKLMPWITDIAGRFSKGYKMPYYFNIYMTIAGKNVRIYSIHLGKMQATNSDGVKSEINTAQITEIINYLAYVPNFVTGQFVFDAGFDITPDSMKAVNN